MNRQINSRWGQNGLRYSPNRKLEENRWIRNRRGRLVHDVAQVDELTWLDRRRPRHGWRSGARLQTFINSALQTAA